MMKSLLMCMSVLAAGTTAAIAQEDSSAGTAFENRYRVGIDCAPLSEALQVHLQLDQGTGLLINSIMDGSPADRAGIKRLDVIVAANDRPVGSIDELVRAVNQAGNVEMTLSLIRRGEALSLKVTPEERDEQEMEQLRRGFRNRLRRPGWQGFGPLSPEVQKQLEQLGPLDDFFRGGDFFGGARGFRRVLPGIMMDQPQNRLPDGFNLNMKVERSGDGPAKITVQKDGKTWEVTEDHLEDLPEDIRPLVENMLNGNNSGWSGLMIPGTPGPMLEPPSALRDRDDQQLRKRFDGLELQLQELQDAIRSLQDDN